MLDRKLPNSQRVKSAPCGVNSPADENPLSHIHQLIQDNQQPESAIDGETSQLWGCLVALALICVAVPLIVIFFYALPMIALKYFGPVAGVAAYVIAFLILNRLYSR